MSSDPRHTLAKAALYLDDEDACWLVTQTPGEAAAMVRAADPDELLEFSLGNESPWNGKPLYVRAGRVAAISPPKSQSDDDD